MRKICLIWLLTAVVSAAFSQNIAGRYKGALKIKYHAAAKPEVKPQAVVRVEKAGDTYTAVVSDMSFGHVKIRNFTLDSIETQAPKVKNTTELVRYKIKEMLIPQGEEDTFVPAQAMLKSGRVTGNRLEMELWINTGLGLSLVVNFNGNKY